MGIEQNKYYRISWSVHHKKSDDVLHTLANRWSGVVYHESCRTVRQRIRPKSFFLSSQISLDDSPSDLLTVLVPAHQGFEILKLLSEPADISSDHSGGLRGSGMLSVQEVICWAPSGDSENPSNLTQESLSKETTHQLGLLENLSVITLVLSNAEFGEQLAELSLNLGAGVPIISLGEGTGIREKLGLLRITVPASKEILRILVPGVDAPGIARQLIERGKLNRPGQGFVYITPVARGILDPRLKVGEQDQPASVDQIVAALDTLHRGTFWRQRYLSPGDDLLKKNVTTTSTTEITFKCEVDTAGGFIERAINQGAPGATTSTIQKIQLLNGTTSKSIKEKAVIIAEKSKVQAIVQGLQQGEQELGQPLDTLEVQDCSWVFSYRK